MNLPSLKIEKWILHLKFHEILKSWTGIYHKRRHWTKSPNRRRRKVIITCECMVDLPIFIFIFMGQNPCFLSLSFPPLEFWRFDEHRPSSKECHVFLTFNVEIPVSIPDFLAKAFVTFFRTRHVTNTINFRDWDSFFKISRPMDLDFWWENLSISLHQDTQPSTPPLNHGNVFHLL